jgi:hypothetical protein
MRGAEPEKRGSEMRRYLVVANQTLGGEHLIERVRECLASGPCRFHVVVPATPSQEHASWTEGEAVSIAQGRLDRALERFRELGAEADGEVGDANPMLAVEDVLLREEVDEIILSTLPPGPSRWLKRDLPTRMRERLGVPVTHLIEPAETVTKE